MNWLTPAELAKEAVRMEARKLQHEQGRCGQNPRHCHYCHQEERDAKTGGPEYEAALDAYFGRAS